MKLDDLITMDRATLEAMVRANPDLVDELVSLAEMAGVEAAISNVNSFISQVLKVEKTTKTGLKAGELVQQAPYHVAFQEALDHPKRNAVIFGHVEQGKCVVSSTIFQLESGEAVTTLELKSRMERGEVCKVLDHDPATGRTEYVRVKEVFYNGVRPCKTVELADRLITYSDEHPMWVRRDGVDAWVPAHEVQRGDHLLTVSPTAEGKPMADGDALLLGMLQPVTRWRHRVLRSWWMGTMQFLSIKHTLLGRLAMPDVAPAFRALLKERGIPYVSEVRKGGRATTTMFDAAWLETWGAYHHIYAKQGSPQCKVRIKFAETSSDMPRAVVAGGHDAALWYIAGTILSAPAVSPDGGLPRVRLISDSGLWLLLDRLRVAYRREYANPTSCKLSLYPCDATDRILDAVGAVCPPLQERVEQECAGRERKERGETSWSRVFRLHDAGEQPTWGVEMCGERHTHVTDGVLTHNTQQLAGRYLWEIGHNPNIRIVHIQATKDQATATSAAIKRYIEEDENYHRIFPHVRPGHPWVDTKWSVERDYNVIHPTFQAAGYRGRVTGNRIDLLGLDDIIDLNNVITQTMRDAVERWIRTVLLNRLTDGGRVWFVGNAWHKCLLPEQVVATTVGPVDAASITLNHRLLTGKAWEPPKAAWSRPFRGQAQSVRIAGMVDPLRVTWNHPVMTKRGEVLARDLVPGDMVASFRMPPLTEAAILSHEPDPPPPPVYYGLRRRGAHQPRAGWSATPEWWRFFGYALAEGCIDSNRLTLTFGLASSETERAYAEDAARCFTVATGLPAKVSVHPGDEQRGDTLRVRASAKACAQWLAKAGGRVSTKKNLAAWVEQAPHALLREMLLGYHRGDGSTGATAGTVRCARFTTSSKALAYSLQRLLDNVGAPASMYSSPTARSTLPSGVEIVPTTEEAYELRVGRTHAYPVAAEVSGDKVYRPVVSNEPFEYAGPVYDVTTSTGWFTASNVVTHNSDAMHRLAEEDGWHVAKFPVRDPQTKVPFWTAGWSQERIDETVARIGNPLEVARVLDCVPRSDEAGAFKQIWFDAAFNAGLNIFGPKAYYDKTPPKNWVVFAGLDIAISKSARADLSAIFIFAVMPGGWKVPLRILKGRWDGVEILQTLFAVNWLYQPKRIYVESNAAQDHIRQFLRNPAIMAAVTSGRPDDASLHLPVVPFRTQGTGTRFNKHHKDYGVEGLATEFSAGIWRIPTATIMEEGEDGPVQTQYVDPDILEWVQGMLYYSSEDTHVPDDLMASWFANEGVRSTGGGGMSVSTLEGGQQEERIELVDGDGSPYEMTPRRLSASNSLWDGLREEMGE